MKQLLCIEVTFVDEDFEYYEYECGNYAEVAALREVIKDKKFVSAKELYG
ncbi:hypothetical protein [Paenibacillus chitinolyticus]